MNRRSCIIRGGGELRRSPKSPLKSRPGPGAERAAKNPQICPRKAAEPCLAPSLRPAGGGGGGWSEEGLGGTRREGEGEKSREGSRPPYGELGLNGSAPAWVASQPPPQICPHAPNLPPCPKSAPLHPHGLGHGAPWQGSFWGENAHLGHPHEPNAAPLLLLGLTRSYRGQGVSGGSPVTPKNPTHPPGDWPPALWGSRVGDATSSEPPLRGGCCPPPAPEHILGMLR